MKAFWTKSITILVTIILMVGLLSAGGAAPSLAANQSYIVQGLSTAETALLVEKYGGTVTSQLEIIDAVGANLSPAALEALRADSRITQITANAVAESSDGKDDGKGDKNKTGKASQVIPATDYPDVTGADMVWKQGITGKGVTVAVLDTGIDLHPSLLVREDGKNRQIVAWVDFIDKNNKNPIDPNGHGTHIAGIIGNSEIGADKEYNGMAPGVDLVGVRVLDQTGYGTYETIIKGLQWVIQNKEKYNIRVVNLSLQTAVHSPYWADPLNKAVTKAWSEGLVVITVAGNAGPDPMTVSVPGNNPYAVTVGAFTDNYTPSDWSDDYITPFSGAGPTLDGFVKPDLIAPGAHMVSTLPNNSVIAANHEANWVSGKYFSMAGTSQASAVVSGTAALMIARNPKLTPDQVKYRLMISAMPWIKADGSDTLYSIWQQGAGRVNAYEAVMNDGPEMNGSANAGMDIKADLKGKSHYEGYSYYDASTGTFKLKGTEDWTSGFGSWSGGFGSWSGGFGSWSGGFGSWSGGFGSWSGGFGSWSGGFGSWSGGFGSWSGGFGSWSGGFGSWSGGFGSWSGGFGSWSGGFGSWSGSVPWAAGFASPDFITNFESGKAPKATNSAASVQWIDEPTK